MIFFRSALFQIFFYFSLLFVLVVFLPLLLLKRKWIVLLGNVYTHFMLWGLKLICGLDYKITGLENLPPLPFIVACKHQSTWETFIFNFLVYNPGFILKKELLQTPFFGWYLTKLGSIGIDRLAGDKTVPMMLARAKEVLAEGRAIVVFPEGTRRPYGAEPQYKPGIMALYKDNEVPIVPIGHNAGKFWGRRSFAIQPGLIEMRIGEPIAPLQNRGVVWKQLIERIESLSV